MMTPLFFMLGGVLLAAAALVAFVAFMIHRERQHRA